MYSPVRQVSQSPHSYRHDDNIYTSRSRHDIYDLEDDISSKVLKFADDTKVFRKVTDVRGGLGELGHRESWATPNFMEVASCCGQVLPSI